MKIFKIPKEAPYNTFGIVVLSSGTYVCPGWHAVPKGTTREQIKLIEPIYSSNVKKQPEGVKNVKKERREKPQTWEFLSSNGKKTYVIKNLPFWNCSCPANQFRRGDCKHIKKIKSNLKQKSTCAI